jgi:hypothetical protein
MRILAHDMVPYLPVSDSQGIDAIVRTEEGKTARLQIKSRGWPVSGEDFGEQIKSLPRDSSPFDFLIIVLPLGSEGGYEAWVVPDQVLQKRMSPSGDLNLSRRLLREDWCKFHEAWDTIGRIANVS